MLNSFIIKATKETSKMPKYYEFFLFITLISCNTHTSILIFQKINQCQKLLFASKKNYEPFDMPHLMEEKLI